MPIYVYKCQVCGHVEKLFRPAAQADKNLPICQHGEAGNPASTYMERQLSTPSVRSVETADEYHGIKSIQDAGKMVEERAKDHWRKHELPRFIQENGIEKAIENGWVNPDGTPKT